MKLSFFVHGVPVPKGSMKAIPLKNGKIAVTSANKNLRSWRQDLAIIANKTVIASDWNDDAIRSPVSVVCSFGFPRPKSLPKHVIYKTTKPDIDKLTRAVLDALSHNVIVDDAQVVRLASYKVYSERPGVSVEVETLEKTLALVNVS